jgi:hypothetical protein
MKTSFELTSAASITRQAKSPIGSLDNCMAGCLDSEDQAQRPMMADSKLTLCRIIQSVEWRSNGGRVDSSDLARSSIGSKGPCKPSLARIDKLSLAPAGREFLMHLLYRVAKRSLPTRATQPIPVRNGSTACYISSLLTGPV